MVGNMDKKLQHEADYHSLLVIIILLTLAK